MRRCTTKSSAFTVLVLAVILCSGTCSHKSKNPGGPRRPTSSTGGNPSAGSDDHNPSSETTGTIGKTQPEDHRPLNNATNPDVAFERDESDDAPTRINQLKPQYFVVGPLPEAPPIATRDAEVAKRRQEFAASSSSAGSLTASSRRGTSGGSRPGRLSDSEKTILLNAHNEFRGVVSDPTAANMVQLKWSADLANMAQGWADRCSFAHGNPDNISPFYHVGQNIWAGSGVGSNWAVYDMVESWYEEVDLYNYYTMACSGVCGHYTQLAWAESTHVGCALQTCPTLHNIGWSPATIMVCNYGEGGNYIGLEPYIAGTPCSRCPQGYSTCLQGRLCAEPGSIAPPPPTGGVGGPPANPGGSGGNTGGGGGTGGSEGGNCGGDLTADEGEISSPNWPSPYTANQDCEWNINAAPDETVTITVSYMDIEHHNTCEYDYIMITVRSLSGDSWRGVKYCGNRPLEPFTSDSNVVTVSFHSDGDVHRGGFKATYTINGREQPKPEPCGGVITETSGSLKSPNWPGNYDSDLDCTWTFKAKKNKRVRIKFFDLDIEDDAQCQYDRLTLQLGNERLPLTICGNEKPIGNYISLKNQAVLTFKSDGSTGQKGFSIGYRHI